jgi:hypothetical protein
MGFSVTLTHIIMVIASVCLASAFSAYAFYTGNVVQNELMQNVSDAKRMTGLQLEIVYATVDNSVGSLPFSEFEFLDVYAGEYCQAQLYTYNSTADAGSGKFNLTDANSNGIWEPRETATLLVYPTGEISGFTFEARLVPSRGIGSSFLFPAPAS